MSCDHGGDPGPCTDPVTDYPYAAKASTWLLNPFKAGDTMKFKVYYRPDRSSPYVYRKDENYVVKDTMLKKFKVDNTRQSINCNDFMTISAMVVDITGPSTLSCQLSDESVLQIGFKGKAFNKGASQYQYHDTEWNDSLWIGGKEYYSITRCKGFNSGNPSYTDSSYVFYNQEHGILKFIINDTLTYMRKL